MCGLITRGKQRKACVVLCLVGHWCADLVYRDIDEHDRMASQETNGR